MPDFDKAAFLIAMGERIRKAREVRQMTQEELAIKCGYSIKSARTALSHIELGDLELPVSKIYLIAVALNVTPNYLLGISPNGSTADKVDNLLTLEQQKRVIKFLKDMGEDNED